MAKKQTIAWVLGQRIRYLRQSRGLTMQALVERAAELGFRLPWRTLSDLERGQRKDPQLSTLLSIAGGLGVELSRLVEVLDSHTLPTPEEPPVKNPIDPVEALKAKIARKDALIRKWAQEADACDPSDEVGRAVKRYCQGLARWQQEERERLEVEMRQHMQQLSASKRRLGLASDRRK
jgi:transcriptional regulator with XRE-family HTH domain